MAKIKALITLLVLGTSSIAMAQPSPSFDGRDRVDRSRQYRSSWISLAEPMQLMRGRDTIDVRLRGTLTQVRIQTVAGASYIDRVIVRFRDGSRQVVDVNQAVTPRHRMIEFLLDGNNRHIDSISVVGRSQRNAAIQVFGI